MATLLLAVGAAVLTEGAAAWVTAAATAVAGVVGSVIDNGLLGPGPAHTRGRAPSGDRRPRAPRRPADLGHQVQGGCHHDRPEHRWRRQGRWRWWRQYHHDGDPFLFRLLPRRSGVV